ncbi:MAG: putative antirepressor protein KilAC domain protein [Prokaryotic dsDNA virus sp.]|nr:MAG: putative antirepressor protein KilAC domain protein [Prokaryotic dsDNA virus sp.]|tara:strand:- start:1997 stop:2638 length:642 start_codon:yes stop_codon:yes gene_type:complete
MKNLVNTNQTLTMSSKDIAAVVNSRHDSVKRTMVTLQDKGLITFTQTVEKGDGRPSAVLHVNKRDSYVVVAQLSPEFTAVLVDRWQELESNQQQKIPTNFAEALQLAADQAKQLELAAPKVAFVDNLVNRDSLMTATQVASKHKMSAVKLNKLLDELGGVYNQSVKRGRVFIQSFIESGYGELKQTEQGYSQALFTPAGEVYINEKLISEGVI